MTLKDTESVNGPQDSHTNPLMCSGGDLLLSLECTNKISNSPSILDETESQRDKVSVSEAQK